MLFLVAKLLYNSLFPSVNPKRYWGNAIFSAPIQDRQFKFLVKIPMTYARPSNLYIVFFHLSVIWGAKSIPRFYSFRDFLNSHSR